MTPREPEDVDRKLRRWLWQEEQKYKRARHTDVAAIVVHTVRSREHGPTKRERRAALALAEAANADAESITLTPKTARIAREMLELDWPDVAKLSGIIASAIIAFENAGRSTAVERRRLQAFYEGEGLAFSRDGGVAWAE